MNEYKKYIIHIRHTLLLVHKTVQKQIRTKDHLDKKKHINLKDKQNFGSTNNQGAKMTKKDEDLRRKKCIFKKKK